MDACVKDLSFEKTPRSRKYYKLHGEGSQDKTLEIEYLPLESISCGKRDIHKNNKSSSPNFVIDGIRNRMRLSLGMRLILIISASITTLICLLSFGGKSH